MEEYSPVSNAFLCTCKKRSASSSEFRKLSFVSMSPSMFCILNLCRNSLLVTRVSFPPSFTTDMSGQFSRDIEWVAAYSSRGTLRLVFLPFMFTLMYPLDVLTIFHPFRVILRTSISRLISYPATPGTVSHSFSSIFSIVN